MPVDGVPHCTDSPSIVLKGRFAMPTESANFKKIKQVIKQEDAEQERTITARLSTDETGPGTLRKLWPHVLGRTTVPDSNPPLEVEMVLCYQYGGYSKDPIDTHHDQYPRKNFRCFKVESLLDVVKELFQEEWTPKKLKFRQVKKQSCVDDVDFFR